MAQLSVELTADIKKLERELDKAKKELLSIDDAAERTNKQGQKSFDNLGKSVSNTTPTLLEFNRVVQDAPFGIQGVANNLTQLTQNFGQLSQSAGGSRNALKLLASSFVGPAGVLFAVSAVTSILVTYGDELFKSTSLSKEFTKAANDLIASVVAERSSIESLLNVARNISLSYSVRQKAIDKLNKDYPDYLGNLNQENINSTQTANAVNQLTKALLNQAKVRGIQATLENRISENSAGLTKGLIDRQRAARAVEEEIGRLTDKYSDFISVEGTTGLGQRTSRVFDEINKNLGGASSGIGDRLQDLVAEFNKADQGVKEAESSISGSVSELQSILNNFTLQDFLSGDSFDAGEVIVSPEKAKQQGAEAGKEFKTALNLEIFGRNIEIPNFFPLGNVQKQGQDAGGVFLTALQTTIAGRTITIPNLNVFGNQLEETSENYQTFADRLSATTLDLSTSISDGFASIGNALAQGGSFFDAVGRSILSTIGQIAVQLGQATIAAGVAAISLKGLFANPAAAIAAGGLLVALGTALSSATSSVGAIGTSGVGGQGSVGFRGSTSFSSSAGSFSDGTVVFEIEGQKLVGVLNRTLGRNGRLGGNLSLS